MSERMAHDLNDADESILDMLAEGRNTPQNMADRLEYSRQYVQNRLQMLKAADYVSNLGGGLYELVEDPRPDVDATEEEEDPRQQLLDEIHEKEQTIQELESRLDNIPDYESSVDVEAIRHTLDDIEAAAERGDGDALQEALRRARDALGG